MMIITCMQYNDSVELQLCRNAYTAAHAAKHNCTACDPTSRQHTTIEHYVSCKWQGPWNGESSTGGKVNWNSAAGYGDLPCRSIACTILWPASDKTLMSTLHFGQGVLPMSMTFDRSLWEPSPILLARPRSVFAQAERPVALRRQGVSPTNEFCIWEQISSMDHAWVWCLPCFIAV